MIALFVLVAQAATPVPAAQPTPAPLPDRKICRSEASTGSMMPPKRICHLRSEWAAIDAANGRNVDTFRDRAQRGSAPTGG